MEHDDEFDKIEKAFGTWLVLAVVGNIAIVAAIAVAIVLVVRALS